MERRLNLLGFLIVCVCFKFVLFLLFCYVCFFLGRLLYVSRAFGLLWWFPISRAVGIIPQVLRTRQVELAYLGIVMLWDRGPGLECFPTL